MALNEGTLYFRRIPHEDKRLGRHVLHDSRSKSFQFRARRLDTLRSVQHTINIPIMDQGDLGSCTGHAGTNAIASAAFWAAGSKVLRAEVEADHQYAVGLYSDATKLDPWPGQYTPDDTGSDGLSVAKALQARGLASGYVHAMSLEATLSALAQRVVMIGTNWLSGMFNPGPGGKLNVTGNVEGGHEYVLDELDVEKQRVWMRNSWGPSWSMQGRAWMSWDDLGKLLADDGDCTILVPLTDPAPIPQPPAPAPTPAPVGPTEDALLAQALTRFVHTGSCPVYVRKPAQAWLSVNAKSTKAKGVKR